MITPDSETFAVGQNADIGCVDANPPSAPGNWSTTALSANISNQFVPNAGNFARVTELSLTNVDSGYCGTYTCMFTNPVDSATVSVIVGKHLRMIHNLLLFMHQLLQFPLLKSH